MTSNLTEQFTLYRENRTDQPFTIRPGEAVKQFKAHASYGYAWPWIRRFSLFVGAEDGLNATADPGVLNAFNEAAETIDNITSYPRISHWRGFDKYQCGSKAYALTTDYNLVLGPAKDGAELDRLIAKFYADAS